MPVLLDVTTGVDSGNHLSSNLLVNLLNVWKVLCGGDAIPKLDEHLVVKERRELLDGASLSNGPLIVLAVVDELLDQVGHPILWSFVEQGLNLVEVVENILSGNLRLVGLTELLECDGSLDTEETKADRVE